MDSIQGAFDLLWIFKEPLRICGQNPCGVNDHPPPPPARTTNKSEIHISNLQPMWARLNLGPGRPTLSSEHSHLPHQCFPWWDCFFNLITPLEGNAWELGLIATGATKRKTLPFNFKVSTSSTLFGSWIFLDFVFWCWRETSWQIQKRRPQRELPPQAFLVR